MYKVILQDFIQYLKAKKTLLQKKILVLSNYD